MQVSLKVVGGKNDGRLIAINVPEFVIGRGETAHLRPQSDLVSRAHCSVLVADGKVVLRDLGSRNGTFLNDERLEGEQQVTIGDRFRVGRLQFEFQIDHAVAGSKKPKVEGVREAAARTAATAGEDFDDESITDWLSQDVDSEEVARTSGSETRQFMLDETERVLLEQLSEESKKAREEKDRIEKEETKAANNEPGKLPDRARTNSEDSRDAASQMLRKFFNRR
ncbi:MAG: FHA domain-containing protein [Planctomycetota bacterium]|nr:FHA domain-containing protein [Pirellulaceae bacterium]MDP7377730.1 FHA domain-containing protein [Pirellulaceae bacterium]MEC8507375.1 FHA domain-containing protein [Planctomycetota bacterium]